MQRIVQLTLILGITLSLTGCYHARIETGLTPSSEVIDIPFATSFIYGLVPPATVEASAKCTSGVAIVETQHSFVNQVVAAVTFGIFTPMHITVTCAAGGAMGALDGDGVEMNVSANASREEVIETFSRAADKAAEEGLDVYVVFE